MYARLNIVQYFYLVIIAIVLNTGGCYCYAYFNGPGPYVLLYFVCTLALLVLSMLAGTLFSFLSKPNYFFIGSVGGMFAIATTYTVLLEDVFIFLPLSLFSLVAAYFIAKLL